MVKDNISNFITKLQNAAMVGKPSMVFPQTKLIESIADVLVQEGYISAFEKKGKKLKRSLEVSLSFKDGKPVLQGVTRVSKPSRRIYEKARKLRPVRNGYGRMIISTSKGIMTDVAAKKENLGGEVLFKIW